MQLDELRPGLVRWTGLHPEWLATSAGWEQEVGCVYFEAAEAVVLIDPLVPPEDGERFVRWLDSRVARARLPVAIVLTAPWHARSCAALADRYRATLWANPGGASRLGREVDAVLPAGVEAFEVPPADEGQVALFLPDVAALVTAELLAGEAGHLVVMASPRLADPSELATCLGLLGELPTELVLPAHGAPVLGDGRRAVRESLAHWAPSAA